MPPQRNRGANPLCVAFGAASEHRFAPALVKARNPSRNAGQLFATVLLSAAGKGRHEEGWQLRRRGFLWLNRW